MDTAHIRIKSGELILSYIYYSIFDLKAEAQAILARFCEPEQKALVEYADKFATELKQTFCEDVIVKLRQERVKAEGTDADPEHEDSSVIEADYLASGELSLNSRALRRLALMQDYALDFLFAFNMRSEIIKELLPNLPDPETAYEIAERINRETETPDNCTLIAASAFKQEAGYVLKSREFQGYVFSIYRENEEQYSFEFISRQNSLKDKIIHVSIITPQGEPVIIEELCCIDTRQFTLSYSGSLPVNADIQPAIISASRGR